MTIDEYDFQVTDKIIYEEIEVMRVSIDRYSERFYPQLNSWKTTSEGIWCLDKCAAMKIVTNPHIHTLMVSYTVCCLFRPKDATLYRLLYADSNRW